MLRRVLPKSLVVALLALAPVAFAACDEDPITPPTAPDPVTETVSGSITRNGAESKPFTVSSAGSVTATLKTIGADNTLVVGFMLGNWVNNSCSVVVANDAATGGAVLTGTMSGPGTLCVRMYDVGNVPAGASVPYSVEVVHP
jgi:hypothetical protein